MRVLMMAINDPAGCAMAFAQALTRYGLAQARVVTLETRYTHGWQRDLHVPDLAEEGLAELEGLLRDSDIFHFHMTADEHLRLGPFVPADYLAGKVVVHHHHGHPAYRADPEPFREKYRRLGRRKILVSTPDLLRLFPEAVWQPNLVPQDDPRYLPRWDKAGTPVGICHAPTRKELKNTEEFLAAMERLRAQGLPVRLELIDDVAHNECLARKAACHVCFDHLQGYYGVSSLESLAQGLAVVAGLDNWCQGHMREFAGQELPWVVSRPGRLEADLRRLVLDSEERQARGRAGRAFMETAWSDRRLAARLAAFYAA